MQKILLLFIVILISNCNIAQTRQDNRKNNSTENYFPKPIGYVNDYALILDSLDIEILETKLKDFENKTTNQITIITLDNNELTEGNFDKYALDLVNNWGVGTKEKNNGLAIVLSLKLRKIRINTGLGTEKILTDQICKNIIESIIIPEFKTQNYFNGLDKATDTLIKLWN